jgi:hypothetical protein
MAGMDTGLGELGLWRKGVYNVVSPIRKKK